MGLVLSMIVSLAACSANDAKYPPNGNGETTSNNAENQTETDSDAQFSLETIQYIPDFNCVNAQGNKVDQTLFANSDYTMIVLWGTWCGPCVAEIPVLEESKNALSEIGVQVVGVCEDGGANGEEAQQILQEKGATYTNIFPDEKFYDDFVSLCFSFPSALLVDVNGNVVKTAFHCENTQEELVDQVKGFIAEVEVNPQQNTNSTSVNGFESSKQDAIHAIYQNFSDIATKENYVNCDTIEKNIPLVEDLHKKAYAYCTDSYYYESEINAWRNGTAKEKSLVKNYYDNGNYRIEQYTNGDLTYLTLYNQKEDTYYFYTVKTKGLDRVTNASKKGRDGSSEKYGCFNAIVNNAIRGDFEESEYKSTPAVKSVVNGGTFYHTSWFDKEKGILLCSLQEEKENGKLISSYEEINTVKPKQQFDPVIFTFDQNKLTAEDLLG